MGNPWSAETKFLGQNPISGNPMAFNGSFSDDKIKTDFRSGQLKTTFSYNDNSETTTTSTPAAIATAPPPKQQPTQTSVPLIEATKEMLEPLQIEGQTTLRPAPNPNQLTYGSTTESTPPIDFTGPYAGGGIQSVPAQQYDRTYNRRPSKNRHGPHVILVPF